LIQPAFSTTLTLDVATAPAVGQELVRVRPSTIKFTHDSIKDRFQDGNALSETAVQIARQDVGKRDIRMITVVRLADGRLFSLDNRRLAVFRLLEMCGKVGTIKVGVMSISTCVDEWNRKVTTTNGGETILVRPGNYMIGKTRGGTNVPWLPMIESAHPRGVMPDAQFSIFLATFTDE
jgi:hypothetical protein